MERLRRSIGNPLTLSKTETFADLTGNDNSSYRFSYNFMSSSIVETLTYRFPQPISKEFHVIFSLEI